MYGSGRRGKILVRAWPDVGGALAAPGSLGPTDRSRSIPERKETEMADEREAAKRAAEEVEGHMPRRANEESPDTENADPQTRGPRRENLEPGAEEIEGHMPYRRANEPGPDAENADPQTRGPRRENLEPGAETDGEPEIEGHRKTH
jgi:hypothetical protein